MDVKVVRKISVHQLKPLIMRFEYYSFNLFEIEDRVWFDTLGTDGREYVSSVVSNHDKIIVSRCDAGSIRVRPSGNSTYPPEISTPNPSGFTIKIDLGGDGVTNVEVTAKAISTAASGVYTEWVGTMTGSANGGEQMTGSFEMFKLTD